MPTRWLLVPLLGALATACASSKSDPRVPASAAALAADEEQTLATAVAMKRSGDPDAAWKLLEALPVSSPARLDRRYTEVMSAWVDARTGELPSPIAAGKGGGPPAFSVEAGQPPSALSADEIEGIVASKRPMLRHACFGDSRPTSFLLELRIDEEGRVVGATTSGVKGDALVAACVGKHAQSWTFPKNLEGAQHKTRFMFAR